MSTATHHTLVQQASIRLNTAQQKALAVPMHQPVQVLAGAGTGKTTLMAYRTAQALYAAQLQHNASQQPEPRSASQQVLAVTFTVKAAEEMTERVAKVLKIHASANPNDEIWQTLHQDWASRDGMDSSTEDMPWIHNFHGLGQRLLRTHGLALGWSPQFSVIGQTEQRGVWEQLLGDLQQGNVGDLAQALAHSDLAHTDLADGVPSDVLTPQRLGRLPVHPLGHFLDTLPQLIGRLKTAGLTPSAFMASASQDSQAFSDCLANLPQSGLGGQPPEVNTDLCDWWGQHLAPYVTPGWAFSGTADDLECFMEKRLAASPRAKADDTEPYYKQRCDWLNNHIQLALNGENHSPLPRFSRGKLIVGAGSDYLKQVMAHVNQDELAFIPVIAAVYALYQFRLFQRQVCDTDDLILHPVTLLQRFPHIAQQCQQQFMARIVDECQDTNGSQLALIHHLTPPTDSGLMVVGDEKQAIYGFRFALPENIHHMMAPVQEAVATVALTENYRSSTPILAVANGVARLLNPSAQASQLTASGPNAGVTEPVRHLLITPPSLSDSDDGTDGNGQSVTQADILAKETDLIVETITEAIQQGRAPNDIAVLVNSHAKAAELAKELATVGVASQRDKYSVLGEPDIKPWLWLLRWLANPHDDAAIVALLQTKLTDAQLMDLASGRHQLRQKQATPNLNTNQSKRALGFDATLAQLKDSQFLPHWPLPLREACVGLQHSVGMVRQQLRYGDWVAPVNDLATALDLWHTAGQLPEPVEALTQWLLNHQHQRPYRGYTLRQWVNHLLAAAETGEALGGEADDDTGEGVHLLTTHASKGLEFPLVIIAACFKRTRRGTEALVGFEPRFGRHADGPPNKQQRGFGLYLRRHRGFIGKSGLTTLKQQVVNHIWRYPREDAEQQRLFYVAITRAMEGLVIIRGTASPDWTDPNKLVKPSQREMVKIEIVDVTP